MASHRENGDISNGSLENSNRCTVNESCRRAFRSIIDSQKFVSLCKLLSENFRGIKADNVFDFSLVNSRIKEGAYENSSTLFLSDIQQACLIILLHFLLLLYFTFLVNFLWNFLSITIAYKMNKYYFLMRINLMFFFSHLPIFSCVMPAFFPYSCQSLISTSADNQAYCFLLPVFYLFILKKLA